MRHDSELRKLGEHFRQAVSCVHTITEQGNEVKKKGTTEINDLQKHKIALLRSLQECKDNSSAENKQECYGDIKSKTDALKSEVESKLSPMVKHAKTIFKTLTKKLKKDCQVR